MVHPYCLERVLHKETDPLAMPMYAISLIPVIQCLRGISPVPYGFDRDLLNQSTKFGTVTS